MKTSVRPCVSEACGFFFAVFGIYASSCTLQELLSWWNLSTDNSRWLKKVPPKLRVEIVIGKRRALLVCEMKILSAVRFSRD